MCMETIIMFFLPHYEVKTERLENVCFSITNPVYKVLKTSTLRDLVLHQALPNCIEYLRFLHLLAVSLFYQLQYKTYHWSIYNLMCISVLFSLTT